MIKFNDRLKEVRKNKNLKQKEVAAQLGISETCYAGYEQGYREPDLTMLKKICIFFNETSDYLLGIEDKTGRDQFSKYNINNSKFGNNTNFF